uniref:GYF domain-containing protein n=1 Tax=Syphacia muris TaxID=451379 RepID=A0A0N5AZN9_9BILA
MNFISIAIYKRNESVITLLGPYSSLEMLNWRKSGYFSESMLMRTESEDRFHTLAEWTHYSNGQSPFLCLVNSFEQLINFNMGMQLSHMILAPTRAAGATGSFVVVPPPGGCPPPVSINGFSPNTPGFVAYSPSLMISHPPASSLPASQPLSQPPSEPVDDLPSTTSNTPDDSEAGWNPTNYIPTSNSVPCCWKNLGTEDAPWSVKKDAETTPLSEEKATIATQTEPVKVTMEEAARLLSDLFGTVVQVV